MSTSKFRTKTYWTPQRSGDWEGLKITPAAKGGGYVFADTEAKDEKIQKSQAIKTGFFRLVGDKQPVLSAAQDTSNSQHDVQQVNPLKFTDDEVRLLIQLKLVDPDAIVTIKNNILDVLVDRLGDPAKVNKAIKKAGEVTEKEVEAKVKANADEKAETEAKAEVKAEADAKLEAAANITENPVVEKPAEVTVVPEKPSLAQIKKMTFVNCLKVATEHQFAEAIADLEDEKTEDTAGKEVVVTKLQQARQILINTFYPEAGE